MNSYNPAEVAQQILDAVKKEYAQLRKLNVMVLGKTGVGKSTLINNMFMKKVAKTGVGKPITSSIRKIEQDDFPLTIYDTPGLELSGENSVENLLDEVKTVIANGVTSGDISKAIHCIWYCISTPSHRVEDAEIKFLKEFINETKKFNVPIIIVLTQSYAKKDASALEKEIVKLKLNVEGIVTILAEDYKIDDDYTAKAFGLDKLSDVMHDTMPEAVQKTFICIQSVNLKLKKDKAQAAVTASALAAAGICAIPLPFSDAAGLVPTQIGMLTSITVIFGLPIEKVTLVGVLSATIGTAGATVLGKTVVSTILKFIPGVNILTGVVSAGTASAITAALGEAYIRVLEMICKGELKLEDLGNKKGQEVMSNAFTELLKLKRDDKGNVE